MSPLVGAEGPAPSSSGMDTVESVSVDLQTMRVDSGALCKFNLGKMSLELGF